jgi:hypothetical protein
MTSLLELLGMLVFLLVGFGIGVLAGSAWMARRLRGVVLQARAAAGYWYREWQVACAALRRSGIGERKPEFPPAPPADPADWWRHADGDGGREP